MRICNSHLSPTITYHTMKEIGNAIRRAGREEITIKSVLSNTIKGEYYREIDIVSIQIKGNKVLVKTGSTLINSELTLLA